MSGQLSLWDEAPRKAPPLSDDPIRRRIVEEVDRSCLVEASAGTGKTRLLVDRVLNLVRSGARLDQLVAITFTEKAASELRARIRDRIQAAWRDQSLTSEERGRFDEALKSLESATISTIHSFCTQILRARPVEGRVSPGFVLAGRVEADRLRDEAWEVWKEREFSESDSPLLPVLEAGGKLGNLRDLADVMVENRDLLGAGGPRPGTCCTDRFPSGVTPSRSTRRRFGSDTFRNMEALLEDCRNRTTTSSGIS